VADSTYCSENVKFKLAYAVRHRLTKYAIYIDEKPLDQINSQPKAEYTQALSTTNYVMPINVFDINK